MATIEMEMTAAPASAAAQTVFQLATGYMVSAALHVAVRLNIADQLTDGPVPVRTLARNSGVQEDALYRILRALASVGLFEEPLPRSFALNATSRLLRSEPGSLRDLALFLTDKLHFQVYADMLHSVKTGRPAVEQVAGTSVFDLFARDPEESESFNRAMTSMSAAVIPAALAAYDFSGIRVLVDVAGGHGHVLASVLRQYPAMRGVLFDIDHVIAGAPATVAAMGVADRCEFVAGDFFQSVPAGDAYVMKHIIHDWDDDKALVILRNIRAALGDSGGRVVLLESVLTSGSLPDLAKLGDLEMLLMPGGRERTAQEFGALFARAGFELTRIVPTASPLSVIEARAR